MLFIVLVLVLAALGLLVASLVVANTLWAWISVGVSLAAAAVLVADWSRHRRRAAGDDRDRADRADRADGDRAGDPEPVSAWAAAAEPPRARAGTGPPEAGAASHGGRGAGTPPGGGDPDGNPAEEPGEEPTDAADLLTVSELAAEVRVVDERPRYHLAECGWLAGRPTIGLPVSEARQLGFTPCGRCTPDATLAVEHRTLRAARRQGRP